MAKFVSDSLIPSKANAPLDKRTEIDTLAKYVEIENPNESLVFYCKDTKKRYMVTSLKEETIEGTSIKRKVIGTYEPFNGLTDEQVQDIEDTKESLAEVSKDVEALETTVAELGKSLDDTLEFEDVDSTDLDDVFDQMDVETADVGDAPAVNFDSLA